MNVSTSRNIREGNYILAVFLGKNKEHKYVWLIQKLLSDNELEVVGLNCSNDNDVSTIQFAQIKSILELPKILVSGKRLCYEIAHRCSP